MSFSHYSSVCAVKELEGKTFVRVEKDTEQVTFWAESKIDSYALFHNQSCCESVYLEEVIGDLEDLENTPILRAEEATSSEIPALGEYDSSHTWTFYKFSTIKGSVTLRWYGTSNGYYSESVECHRWEDKP